MKKIIYIMLALIVFGYMLYGGDNSMSKKEITVSAYTKTIINSLRENYNIVAKKNILEAKLYAKTDNYKRIHEGFYQFYADSVQIDILSYSVEAWPSSQVAPLYYRQVCSAIMIALTDANKQLVESLISSNLNYALRHGRTTWNQLGVEITIEPYEGLWSCNFIFK